MQTFEMLDDTIVAISTAAGQGGIGIVRMSGQDALKIADQIFCSKNKKTVSLCPTHTVHFGWIVKQNLDGADPEIVDEVLLTMMKGPKSYTMEDVVEISCHGGIISLKTILEIIILKGARLAEPGEFTKRAFLNGRIDLAQAEAVLDVIQSKTEAFLKVSVNQLKGELSVELEKIREALMNVFVQIEAEVNFPDEGLDAQGRSEIDFHMGEAEKKVRDLLATADHGKILKEGIKIVLCGKPNVGKSSLLNVFLRQPRAIVSDIEGTTRDTIEETANIKGVPFQVVDTAGILQPRDVIEEEAVKRSHMYMQSADLVLLIVDGSVSLSEADFQLMKNLKDQNIVIVINKIDLNQKIDCTILKENFPKAPMVGISVLNNKGIGELQDVIITNVWHGKVDTHGLMISNMRHIESLKQCLDAIGRGQNILEQGMSLEFISEEVKLAVRCLDRITGRDADIDLLENIFSQFCVGK